MDAYGLGPPVSAEPKELEVADFLMRHSIHHFFSPECAMCTNQAGWQRKLAELKIFDGLRMFGSVPFEGLISKPISDRDMLDILFGRIRFFYHLHGDGFIDLCREIGLNAGYSTQKEFNRWRSSGNHYVVGFNNRLLWTKNKESEATFYFTEGELHDMCLNWIHPYWWARQDFDVLFSATNNMQGARYQSRSCSLSTASSCR